MVCRITALAFHWRYDLADGHPGTHTGLRIPKTTASFRYLEIESSRTKVCRNRLLDPATFFPDYFQTVFLAVILRHTTTARFLESRLRGEESISSDT